MSASEKLECWYEHEIYGARGEALTERAIEEMQRILPQIVAVVEAAEQTALAYQYGAGLLEPLAALDEALS